MARPVQSGCRSSRIRCHFSRVAFVGGLLTAMPFAAADGPGALQWWSSGGNDAPAKAEVTEASHSGSTVGTARVADRSPASETPSRLEWWDAKQTADALDWWLVPRPDVDLSPSTANVDRTVAQQAPLAPPRRPASGGLAPSAPPRSEEPLRPRTPEPTAPSTLTPATPPATREDDPLTEPGVVGDPFAVLPVGRLRPLSEVRVALDTPAEQATDDGAADFFAENGVYTLAPRSWSAQTPEAAAYQFYSRPLWFEDANLERCGVTACCCQPLVSGAYFFGNTLLLPYRMAAEPQCVTVPAKQFCPPGCHYTCTQNYLPPPSAAGVVAQTAAVTGLFFLIP